MAGTKEKTVVAVISGMTATQAKNIVAAIVAAKNSIASLARGTIAIGDKEDVGRLLNSGLNSKGGKKLGSGKK